MFVDSADSAAGPENILCKDRLHTAFGSSYDDPITLIILRQYIHHFRMCSKGDIFLMTHMLQQCARNLFSGNIIMIKNSVFRMCPLSGIKQLTAVSGKIHAIADQLVDNLPGGTNHNIHRFLPVLIMSCPKRIFKKAVVILRIPENAYSALGQKRITLFRVGLRNH